MVHVQSDTSIEKGLKMASGDMVTLVTQGGSTAILLLVLSRLWKEYLKQSAWMRKKIDEQDRQIRAIAHHVGMSSQDLTRQAEEVRSHFTRHST